MSGLFFYLEGDFALLSEPKKFMKLTAEQKQFIRARENDDVRNVALRFSGEDMPFLLAQIAGRQMAKHKIPSWYANDEIVYPAHISLEQASSEVTAQYKSSIIPQGKTRFVDLTGGLGVDFSFLARNFNEAIYVEQNPELCTLAEHNFRELGLSNFSVIHASAEDALKEIPEADVIYLDPSRRDGAGHKVFRIEDCNPDVTQLQEQLFAKSDAVLIKYSPMLDISLAVKTLENVREVHVISVENECKELLLLLSKNGSRCIYHTVNLKKNGETETFSFRQKEEQESELTYASQPEKYLYEPNASVLKSGAFNVIAAAFSVKKLHKNSHLYTSNELVRNFPGRIFEVQHFFAPNKRNIRRFVSETKKANISVRNFPMPVAEIRRQSGLKDGGDVYVFATTLADNEKVWIVCEKV